MVLVKRKPIHRILAGLTWREMCNMVIPTLLSAMISLLPYNFLSNIVYELVKDSPVHLMASAILGYLLTISINIPISVMLYNSHIGKMSCAKIINITTPKSFFATVKPLYKYVRIIKVQLCAVGWQLGCIGVIIGMVVLAPQESQEHAAKFPWIEAF